MREHHLWTGYPEETNAPYGVSKLALLEASQAYRKQYGLNAIHVIPTNLYGPGDNFADESSHVIPALIKRFCRAVDEGAEEVTIWGTGNASRAFLHVQDCAEGIVAATADYDSTEPVNLGPSETWAIFHLAQRIADMTGFRGRIAFDESKPDGQPRRCVNADRAKEAFGWHPRVKFDDGLAATVAWWREKCAQEAANAA
jgi:GDP-L-fucose synthase